MSPGIDVRSFLSTPNQRAPDQPLVIGWVSRWEHDKRPDLFLLALQRMKQLCVPFKLLVLGQQFRSGSPFQVQLQEICGAHLLHAGYIPDRSAYAMQLGRADVVVSTAEHEFFGLGILEAVAAGCVPCVPDRLVYPEIYPDDCLYAAGSDEEVIAALTAKLSHLSQEKAKRGTLSALHGTLGLAQLAARFDWRMCAQQLDDGLSDLRDRGAASADASASAI
jgi:glycosyltransferase involved in cell wall biosynthesis